MTAFENIVKLSRVVDEMRLLGEYITPQSIHLLLLVATNPAITAPELAARTRLSPASISRNLALLGQRHRKGQEGLDLIEAVEDIMDRRVNHYWLTAQGRAYVIRLARIMDHTVEPDPAEFPLRRDRRGVGGAR